MEMFHTGRMPVRAFGHVDAARDIVINNDGTYTVSNLGTFPTANVVVSLEMLEHVEPEHARRTLQLIHKMLSATEARGIADVGALISTPCWDPHVGAAANHCNEMLYSAFGALLEDLGFTITDHWGTFASQANYLPLLSKEERRIFDKLSEYHCSNYLATVFAPMFPAASRNCLWQVKPAGKAYQRKFPALVDVPGPWTSSEKWQELAG